MNKERDFLNNLVGRWQLTGTMGEIKLHQEILAHWILNDTFLRMHCKSDTSTDNPTAEYEAVYHIGYNPDEDLFIMHLLDTTEVPVDCVVGRGVLEENRIAFRFEYEDTPFLYEFKWAPGARTWDLVQTFELDGKTNTFATKHLGKISSPIEAE
ncbi:MAG: hypothetical protein PVI81_08040 [Anaerolineales bacterium]|jgi:hypothetical protein